MERSNSPIWTACSIALLRDATPSLRKTATVSDLTVVRVRDSRRRNRFSETVATVSPSR
jgi:hypothetical protein